MARFPGCRVVTISSVSRSKTTMLSHESLLAAQDSDGVWHTVIADRESTAECSATTMIVYGLLKLVRLGVLPARFRDPARQAWAAVNAQWVKNGVFSSLTRHSDPMDKLSQSGVKAAHSMDHIACIALMVESQPV